MGWIADLLQEIPSAARYKSELEAMEKKVISLESENVKLRQEIQRRDDVIQKEKSHDGRLEEVKEKILVAVAHNEDSTDQQIAHLVGVGVTVASFHLGELEKAKMVMCSYTMGSDFTGSSPRTEWYIDQAGRGYLVNHGLVT